LPSVFEKTMIKYLLIALLLLPTLSYSQPKYDMQDLKELSKSKSWQEISDHLTDISPAKRNKDWEKLADTALLARFEELVVSGDIKKSFMYLDKMIPIYPNIKNNPLFMELRADFGLGVYENCFSFNDENCHKELLGFVKLDPNPLFAFQVAIRVRKGMSDNKAIEYFEVALSKKTEINNCDDADLKISIQSALQTTPDSNYAKAAKKVAFGQCFENLKPNILTAVKNSDKAKSNACAELLSRKEVKGIAEKKCIRFLKNE